MRPSYTSNPIEIYKELKDFVIEESRSSRNSHETLLRKPVRDRILVGKCLNRIKFVRKLTGGILRFECASNESEFREGDFVTLHTGNPFEPLGQAQWVGDGVSSNSREYIDLAVSDFCAKQIDEGDGELTLDASYFDLSPQLLKALDEMGASERGRSRILPLFCEDTQSGGVDPEEYDTATEKAEEEGFNNPQTDAIGIGSSCKWCSLIQGPPGTGKTRVLAQIVRERVARGERVLITACTHRAINEALQKVVELDPENKRTAKIGMAGRDALGTVPCYDNFAETDFELSTEGYVIGATPYCAFSDRLKQTSFDCVIIDEASQMTLPLAIMAMLSAECYVVIGDEKQLPPVVLCRSPMEAQDYGLFQRLGSVSEREILSTSYRMNESICEWVSTEFYLSELDASESSSGKVLGLSGEPSQPWLQEVLRPDKSLVWIPTTVTATRQYSMEESDLVNQIIGELHRRGHKLEEVGIVTPFRRQARVIRNRLQKNRSFDPAELQGLVVDTVERMQGQEREVIILSTAAADSGFLEAVQEFIYAPARLNVIVSRAKLKVIVLAADGFLEIEGSSDAMCDAIEHWRSLKNVSHVVEI